MLPTNSAPTSTIASGPSVGVELADDALVAREQAGMVRAVAAFTLNSWPGHVTRRRQPARERHVDAVVVVGREVDAGEAAAVVTPRRRLVGQQRARRVVHALGLQQLPVANRAELAHRAVHRRDEVTLAAFERPHARAAVRA